VNCFGLGVGVEIYMYEVVDLQNVKLYRSMRSIKSKMVMTLFLKRVGIGIDHNPMVTKAGGRRINVTDIAYEPEKMASKR